MKKVIFGIISILCFFPFSVEALQCTNSQISRYEQLANQIQTTFEYKETDSGLTFNILFHNVYRDFNIVDYHTNELSTTYKNDGSGIIVVSNYLPGKTYKFSILNNGGLCDTKIVKNISVTLPNYNKYYKDPICDGAGSFEFCQKWVNIGNITYDKLVNSVNEYKESNRIDDNVSNDKVNDDFMYSLRNFMAKYYIYIITGILIIISLIMYFINKRRKNKW